jgi:hypothetical protein
MTFADGSEDENPGRSGDAIPPVGGRPGRFYTRVAAERPGHDLRSPRRDVHGPGRWRKYAVRRLGSAEVPGTCLDCQHWARSSAQWRAADFRPCRCLPVSRRQSDDLAHWQGYGSHSTGCRTTAGMSVLTGDKRKRAPGEGFAAGVTTADGAGGNSGVQAGEGNWRFGDPAPSYRRLKVHEVLRPALLVMRRTGPVARPAVAGWPTPESRLQHWAGAARPVVTALSMMSPRRNVADRHVGDWVPAVACSSQVYRARSWPSGYLASVPSCFRSWRLRSPLRTECHGNAQSLGRALAATGPFASAQITHRGGYDASTAQLTGQPLSSGRGTALSIVGTALGDFPATLEFRTAERASAARQAWFLRSGASRSLAAKTAVIAGMV